MKAKSAFRRASQYLSSTFNRAKNIGRDVFIGLKTPNAMEQGKWRLDMFKLVAGTAIVSVGAVMMSPITAAGGSISAAEALYEFEKAGHKFSSRPDIMIL